MKVQKKNGYLENFDPNKILTRIRTQSTGLKVNFDEIAVLTMQGMYDGITTLELDELAATIAHSYTFSHPDYSKLAANLIISRLHKETTSDLFTYISSCDKISNKLKTLAQNESLIVQLQSVLDFSLDYNFDYFGISQLMKSYLLKDKDGKILERPQFMYMRVAMSLGESIEEIIEYYKYLSNHLVSAATPILFNAGTCNQNMISCNLTYLKGDGIEELWDTYKNIAIASSDAAGIGLCIDNLRSSKTKINSTGGNAHGWLGVAKIVNESMNVYNQGGKRPGSCAIYGSVWHKDINQLLELKLITGEEKLRARDLFLAVNIPDNFMRAVESNGKYYLFCPYDLLKHGIDFSKVSGKAFEEQYNKAVEMGLGEEVDAIEIYQKIVKSQIETGVPYVHFIDRSNENSNHSVYGKIKQSNLCIEIMQYSDEDTTAQCCLGSMPVQNFYINDKFNESLFGEAVRVLTRMLNRVIDNNEWSTKESKKGGLEQRAIAIGIQGLSDLFNKMKISYGSENSFIASNNITRFIYNNAIVASNDYAKETGKIYHGFYNSKYGKNEFLGGFKLSEEDLSYGLSNSLFVAYMPTAGTAQLLGSSESFEPSQSNMYIRELEGGKEYNLVNKYLVKDLEELNLWNEELKEDILRNRGSIQSIDSIPDDIKERYRTIWEISQKVLIDLAADRQRFIDQSQSMNLYLSDPTGAKVGNMLLYSWKKGMKTGCYYLRTRTKNQANINLGVKRIETKKVKPSDSLFNCDNCSA